MKMSKTVRIWVDALWYAVAFLLIQLVVTAVVSLCMGVFGGVSSAETSAGTAEVSSLYANPKMLILAQFFIFLITVGVFVWRKWAPFSNDYIRTRPWAALFWIAIMTTGTIIPSIYLNELLDYEVPSEVEKMLTNVINEPLGYLVVGILIPVAEEIVFRGAVLRALLRLFDGHRHWIAIIVSALIFGVVHGNLSQGVHAFIIGLLLGWMYYRTNSIVPGIVLHWINNTLAYIMVRLLPQSSDMKLVELFGGDEKRVWMALVFSLLIFLPSLYQLTIRLKRPEERR